MATNKNIQHLHNVRSKKFFVLSQMQRSRRQPSYGSTLVLSPLRFRRIVNFKVYVQNNNQRYFVLKILISLALFSSTQMCPAYTISSIIFFYCSLALRLSPGKCLTFYGPLKCNFTTRIKQFPFFIGNLYLGQVCWQQQPSLLQ